MPDQETVEPQINVDVAQERDRPRVVAILFHDFHNLTQEGKHNFLGVFDQIIVPADKKRTTPLGFFLRLANTFDSIVEVAIFNPSNKQVGGFSFSAGEKEKDGKKLTQMQLGGAVEFDTPEEGDYWVNVSYQGQSIGGHRLRVELKESEKEPEEVKDGSIGSDNQSDVG